MRQLVHNLIFEEAASGADERPKDPIQGNERRAVLTAASA
jgi:hypothetical protein